MADRIGFIGLGTMGGPMCVNLLAAGYDVAAYDIDPAALDALVAHGATPVASVAACAGAADLLLTSLPHPDHVDAVMQGDGALAALRHGSVWVDLTTNSVDQLRRLAALAPAGVDVVDSPVTGAVDGAHNGTLTLFLGGAETAVRRVQPVLGHLGHVIPCGTLGSGNVVKLVTNQLWFIHAAALGEGFALGLANGVALDVLYQAIQHSVADSFVARHDAPSIFAGHYDPSFPLDLCLKDLRLIADLQRTVGADLSMTEAARRAFVAAGERYGLAAGEMHVARCIEDDADLSFRLDGNWPTHWEGSA